jgi:hypothetical protein
LARGLNAKDIHKEIFPVSGGKCLLRKAVHSLVANVSLITNRLKWRCGSGWDNTQKDFYDTSFDALIKRCDKHINVAGGYVEKYVFIFPGSNITCFTLYSHLWPIYWLYLVKNATFRKLDLFPSSGEDVGSTYFVGSVRKNQPQSPKLRVL